MSLSPQYRSPFSLAPGLALLRRRRRGRHVYAPQHFRRRLSQHPLHVAHKAVDVALPGRFVDDVLVVIVA